MAEDQCATPTAARAPVVAIPPELDAAVGTVAQETARLLRAFIERDAGRAQTASDDDPAHRVGGSTPTTGAAFVDGPEFADHAAEANPHPLGSTCQWCPVCRTVDLVRTMSPDTLERLADLAAIAASTVAELAVQARHPHSDGPPSPRPRTRPRAHPVPVTDDPEEDL